MSSRKRQYSAGGRMYRAVVRRVNENGDLLWEHAVGPWSTAAPAKAHVTSRSRHPEVSGHVEYADPEWIELDEGGRR